jgi:mannose-6-phosphate isomerase-like protein (cupin superfamily)
MQGKSLFDFPIHLGLGASAVSEPQFTGFEWYNDYEKRHGDDLDEGRIVAMYRFEEPWTSWEVHPEGEEVVCCIQGRMTLHQELSDGTGQSHDLGPGDSFEFGPPADCTYRNDGGVPCRYLVVLVRR